MFKLVIQDDEGKTTVVPLIRDEITIGRKEGNTIRLTERNVSRRHARIVRNNGEVQIEDLGSYNGIRVNNARIAERVSLRVSDQVQIGDYKLYLKAEGVEQVDDARTMPIERVDSQVPTEAMPAVPAPTAPLPVQGIPTTPMPAAARAQVAVADTDPSGRPVATAEQVAKLTSTTGYGKLVVVSSNFAGKEFDLTRPQMIVGRTDENDLVINHRSISRNHAKVTRDPDTGRYTISDLQSSNGVRVNGQDYGKVELRRGDVVDLGHVRLRFVEPGEDFVFSRDAVIADVPEAGGKRGLAIALILAVVVLGGVGAFLLLGGKDNKKDGNGSDNGSVVVKDDHQVASGSNPDVVGSDHNVVAETPLDAATATIPTTNPPPDDEIKRISADCLEAQAAKNWSLLGVCADKLAPLDPALAKKYKQTMKQESGAQSAYEKIQQAVVNDGLKEAKALLVKIPEDSTYKQAATSEYTTANTKKAEEYRAHAQQKKGDCKAIATLLEQAKALSPEVVDAVRPYKCVDAVAVNPDKHPHDAGSNAGTPTTACDADAFKQKGDDAMAGGLAAAAAEAYSKSAQCRYNPRIAMLAVVEACASKQIATAKKWWGKLQPEQQGNIIGRCAGYGILREQLDH